MRAAHRISITFLSIVLRARLVCAVVLRPFYLFFKSCVGGCARVGVGVSVVGFLLLVLLLLLFWAAVVVAWV